MAARNTDRAGARRSIKARRVTRNTTNLERPYNQAPGRPRSTGQLHWPPDPAPDRTIEPHQEGCQKPFKPSEPSLTSSRHLPHFVLVETVRLAEAQKWPVANVHCLMMRHDVDGRSGMQQRL
jgi:hypothetical protein